jgi:hypothetical protein
MGSSLQPVSSTGRYSRTQRSTSLAHGGGFVGGSPATHRELVSTIVAEGDVCAHSIDYRQPPEHRFPAAVDDVVSERVACCR